MSLEPIIQADKSFTLWLNSFHSPWSDQFWIFMSDTRIWFPAYAALAVLIVWKLGWKRGLTLIAALALTVFLADQLSVMVKNSVMRLRPCYDAWMVAGGVHCPMPRKGFYGFFSSHASNVFAVAMCSAIGVRAENKEKWKAFTWCIFVWAALVAFSRVMLAMHYFGDIMVGTLFGLALGAAIGYATRLIILKARL